MLLYCWILDILSKFNFTLKNFFEGVSILNIFYSIQNYCKKKRRRKKCYMNVRNWSESPKLRLGNGCLYWWSSLTSDHEPNTIVRGSHPNTYPKCYVLLTSIHRHWIWVLPVSLLDLSKLESPLKSSSHDITEREICYSVIKHQ